MSTAVAKVGLVLADSFGWHDGDVGVGWWIVMMLGMVIFWGLVIAGVVWMLRGATAPKPAADSPLDVLQRRLAQGDISIEEYEQRRAALHGPGDAP